MREIKFRAWDVIDMAMKFFDFYDIHCGVYFPYHWKDSTGQACELDDVSRYPGELMPYTGLRDRNGTRIYERDIMKALNGSLFEIRWVKGLACFDAAHRYDEMMVIGWHLAEVGGNVYENPELVEGCHANP